MFTNQIIIPNCSATNVHNKLLLNVIGMLKIQCIVIVAGGDQESFENATTYLNRKVPVVVMNGSGSAADFICKGYTLTMHTQGLVKAYLFYQYCSLLHDVNIVKI